MPTDDPFSLTMSAPSSELLVRNTETLTLLLPEPFVCAKGHEAIGIDVKICQVCVNEWLTEKFPMRKK